MTKRIALICVHASPLIPLGGDKAGGMNVYIKECSRALARFGWGVDIFTRAQKQSDIARIDTSIDEGVRVVHITAGPAEPMGTAAHAKHIDTFTDGVLRYSDENNCCYTLIASHYWLSGLVGLHLRKVWGVPLISMFHTLGLMKNRIATSEAEREPALRIDSETRIMQQTDALIAATPAERIQMMWLYHADMDRIHIIPPGVDLDHFCPVPQDEARGEIGIAPEDYHLLFVGRLEPLKGIDTLLRAMAHLRETAPDLSHAIVITIVGGAGDHHEMERLRHAACDLGIADRVSFLGPRSQDALPHFYSAADAVVMPSHYESFGMVALEAMACGTPVIASEVGGLAYLIQDGVTGFRVPSRDHEQLADKIVMLLTNPGLRTEMGYAAARYATQYAWDTIARQLDALYNRVIATN